MRILKVEEFEFFQYFENEMDGLRKEEGKEHNQEHTPAKKEEHVVEGMAAESPHEVQRETVPEMVIHQEPEPATPDEMVEALLLEAEQHTNDLMSKAARDASEIVNLAKERAAVIEDEARQNGYEAGYAEGRSVALEKVESEQRVILEQRYATFLESVYTASLDLELQKEEFIKQHMKSLANLAMTVAEKVINISLQSSGQVIQRMILSTMETSSSQQWAKVRISAQDEALLKESGVDLAEALHHVADRVKIVVIEDAPLGTCYVEFPDQIVDASVETQLRNIREVTEELQL